MKNIIITILAIIVIGLGAFLVYDKVITKNNNTNNNVNEKDNNEDKNNENQSNDNVEYNLDDAERLISRYNKESVFTELNNQTKLDIAYQNLNKSSNLEKITYEEINKVYNELFGNETASKENFSPSNLICVSYIFREEQNSYIYNKVDVCGGSVWNSNYSVKSATIKNNKLDIIVYYYEIDPGLNDLYKFRQDSNLNVENYKIASLNNSELIDSKKLTNEAFEKYKSKMDTFTFRFEKYNNNYVLKDIFKN